MPLRIDIKAGEKFLLNNTFMYLTRSAGIIIESKATFLRDRDLISEEDATTTAKKIYYLCQQVYLFEDRLSGVVGPLKSACTAMIGVTTDVVPIIERLESCIASRDFYKALKLARQLVEPEESLYVTPKGELTRRIFREAASYAMQD